MEFEKWMEEISKGTSIPAEEKSADVSKKSYDFTNGDPDDDEEAFD